MGARRVLLIAVLAAAVLIGFVAVQNLASSAVYYLTPTEARERNVTAGTAARLGGQVETGSLRYDPQTRDLRFVLTDGTDFGGPRRKRRDRRSVLSWIGRAEVDFAREISNNRLA